MVAVVPQNYGSIGGEKLGWPKLANYLAECGTCLQLVDN